MMTQEERKNDLVQMARMAMADDRLMDGALYGKLADEIERLWPLLAALKGVIAVSDRKTVEYDCAHAAIAKVLA